MKSLALLVSFYKPDREFSILNLSKSQNTNVHQLYSSSETKTYIKKFHNDLLSSTNHILKKI